MNRFAHQAPEPGDGPPLAPGVIILAHPALQDPNFRRTVVLISAYDPASGAMGVVVNRPLNQSLGSLYEGVGVQTLGKLPLYAGGPVDADQLIIAGWRWEWDAHARFQLHFGLSAEKAEKLYANESPFQMRAYLGYAGWSTGQLEAELERGSWLTSSIQPLIDKTDHAVDLWRRFVGKISPEMRLLSSEPDDLWRN